MNRALLSTTDGSNRDGDRRRSPASDHGRSRQSGRRPLGEADRALLRGARELIGLDEVGRGALAGPVVVAGVAYREIPDLPLVQDSKTLTLRQREAAFESILTTCEGWLALEVWVDLIDRLNILEATRLAMQAIARSLGEAGTTLVVDALELGPVGLPTTSCKHADARFFCVAAASIVAKVHRDRLMASLARRHPRWGWERNKGYGTVAHRRALTATGRGYLHRASFGFSPVLP